MASDPQEKIVVSGRESRGGFRDQPWLIAAVASVVLAFGALLGIWAYYF